MTVGSLFSGVGGFDMGLEAAGFDVRWQVEIDPQARAVLRRHWPKASLHEDVNDVGAANLARVDLICGGFPCQDLSVAGRRAGLAGERSGLFHEFMRIVDELAPRWVLIENVPGLLSSNGGRDMGTVLGTLGDLGCGYTYRVLDLQHFGVPQRRRRVFIVGRAGGFCPPEVLLEPESLPGDPAPGGEAREGSAGFARAGTLDARQSAGGFPGTDGAASGHVVSTLASGQANAELNHDRAPTLNLNHDGAPIAFTQNSRSELRLENGDGQVIGSYAGDRGESAQQQHFILAAKTATYGTTAPTMFASGAGTERPAGPYAASEPEFVVGAIPRRLTPVECERLMGWPDDWTAWGVDENGERVEMADGPRYRMCGNGVGKPHAEWIGRRIMEADALRTSEAVA